MRVETFDYSRRIVHYLLLNSAFENNVSLFSGQMGIALSLSEYSRFMDNSIVLDFVEYSLDCIIEKIERKMNYSFSDGLSGIGWGMEYLIQNNFVEGESVEVCEEIDQKIMEYNLCRISDLSLDTGLEGLLHYVIYHLQGSMMQGSHSPFDENYLLDLYNVCRILISRENTMSLTALLEIYTHFYVTRKIENYNMKIIDFVKLSPGCLPDDISSYALGLKEGLAGMLLTTI